MSKHFTLLVEGNPKPQGSKRGFVISGKAILVDASEGNKDWRKTVTAAIKADRRFDPITGPVNVDLAFWLPRAKSNKTKFPAQKPDIDKLARSVLDAITDSGLIEDDAKVISLWCMKKWADDGVPGVLIQVWPHQDKSDTPTT